MNTSALENALSRFPIESEFRELLPLLMDEDLETREKAYKGIGRCSRIELSENEAAAVLHAATTLEFPPLRHDWYDSAHELLTVLWTNAHPSLVPTASEAYSRMPERNRAALLVLFGATKTRDGALSLVDCVRRHGWPSRMYDRVFSEMNNLLDYAPVLFPELLLSAKGYINAVGDVVLAALRAGKLSTKDLESIEDKLAGWLTQGLELARPFQSSTGAAWRFDEKYWRLRFQVGFFLDLAGWLDRNRFEPLLEQATHLSDPRLVAFAVVSLIRCGAHAPPSAIQVAAECHETRDLLFEALEQLDAEDLFPPEWRTWDAFAASDMVNWLCFPTELGREPDALEKMAVFDGQSDDGPARLYVWRFKTAEEEWKAGVSGPYLRNGLPRPVSGGSTFSCFEAWDSASAEEHAEAVLDTLDEWRQAAQDDE